MLPRVRDAFDRLVRERGLLTPDPAPYFSPLGHPVFDLPVWVALRVNEGGMEDPREALSDVLGVSALGYLHARAQDDWLDGDSKEDPTLIAVAEALVALCNKLLVAVVGSSFRFWTFYAQVLNAYAESLLDMEELRKTKAPISPATFERLLAQSRPLVIPSVALLDRAGQWQLEHHLEEFVLAAAASSQIFNDLTDLYRDRGMGHRTWTSDALGEAQPDELWLEVASASSGQDRGRIQERIGAALFFHQRATRAARELDLTDAEPWLADRQAALEGLVRSLHGDLLSTFVRRMAESGPAGP
jgi:hypothetical protein